jgi:hypothetical protein
MLIKDTMEISLFGVMLLDLVFTTKDNLQIRQRLTNICPNDIVILNVDFSVHWVLAKGVSPDGQTYYVNDPGFNRATYAASDVVRAGIFTL